MLAMIENPVLWWTAVVVGSIYGLVISMVEGMCLFGPSKRHRVMFGVLFTAVVVILLMCMTYGCSCPAAQFPGVLS